MPIGLSAKKSLRKAIKNRLVNSVLRNQYKLSVKKYIANPSVEGLKDTQAIIDKASKNGIIHHNKASRLISRLSKMVGAKAKPVEKKVVKKTTKKTAKEKMSK